MAERQRGRGHKEKTATGFAVGERSENHTRKKNVAELRVIYFVGAPTKCEYVGAVSGGVEVQVR